MVQRIFPIQSGEKNGLRLDYVLYLLRSSQFRTVIIGNDGLSKIIETHKAHHSLTISVFILILFEILCEPDGCDNIL